MTTSFVPDWWGESEEKKRTPKINKKDKRSERKRVVNEKGLNQRSSKAEGAGNSGHNRRRE